MYIRIRNLLPLDVLLVWCLVSVFLQYGLVVWGKANASYTDPIFNLQKKAVTTISFQPRMSPSIPIFNDLKLLKLSEIFELRLFTFVFDSVSKFSPSCFHDFFLFSSSVHQYATRHRPVKVICLCLGIIVFNMVLSQFVTLVLNFEMLYQWNSEMLHQKYRSKQNWKFIYWKRPSSEYY